MRKAILAMLTLILLSLSFFDASYASAGSKKGRPIAQGTFIQKELVRTWDDARWQSEFKYLKEAGMRYIILAPTGYSSGGGPTQTIYPSDRFEMEPGYPDLVDNILRNAEKAGFKVFLGLNFDGDWWSKSARDPQWLNAKMEEGNLIADELYKKYYRKYRKAFYGWYWVWEVDNLNFPTSADQRALADAINLNLRHVNQLNARLPFMLCPFMNAAIGEPEAYKQMWINMFKMTDFRKGDIFAPQDSVGAGGLNMDNFTEWFKALRQAVNTKKGLKFWSDAETFDHRDWSSAPISRFVDQLKGVQPYVDGIITFAYSHYYSPNVGKAAYHRAYVNYVRTGLVESEAPPAPADLSAITDNSATVRLEWSPVQDPGVVGYRIYRNDVLLNASLNQTTFFADRSAEPLTEYTYQVSSVDAAGNESERSDGLIVTTPQRLENLAANRPYTASEPAHANYPDTDAMELTDGIRADSTYAHAAWQGRYLAEPYSVTVDLGSLRSLTEVSVGFLQDLPVGIILPQSVAYFVSDDNASFTKIGEVAKPDNASTDSQTYEYKLQGMSNTAGRYVRIEVDSAGAWSFMDEIEIR